jgi:hypothetical protein
LTHKGGESYVSNLIRTFGEIRYFYLLFQSEIKTKKPIGNVSHTVRENCISEGNFMLYTIKSNKSTSNKRMIAPNTPGVGKINPSVETTNKTSAVKRLIFDLSILKAYNGK